MGIAMPSATAHMGLGHSWLLYSLSHETERIACACAVADAYGLLSLDTSPTQGARGMASALGWASALMSCLLNRLASMHGRRAHEGLWRSGARSRLRAHGAHASGVLDATVVVAGGVFIFMNTTAVAMANTATAASTPMAT